MKTNLYIKVKFLFLLIFFSFNTQIYADYVTVSSDSNIPFENASTWKDGSVPNDWTSERIEITQDSKVIKAGNLTVQGVVDVYG